MTKIVLIVKNGMVDVVECPEGIEIFLRDYDNCANLNDYTDLCYDDEDGGPYVELLLN